MSNNRSIVVEHYPADLLPEELRQGIPGDQTVRVTVEAERSEIDDEARTLKSLVGSAAGVYSNPEAAILSVRHLRDTWE